MNIYDMDFEDAKRLVEASEDELVLLQAMAHPFAYVRRAAASHPKATGAVLWIASRDIDSSVRIAAFENPAAWDVMPENVIVHGLRRAVRDKQEGLNKLRNSIDALEAAVKAAGEGDD